MNHVEVAVIGGGFSAAATIVNLMEALKQSVEETGKVKALPESKSRKVKALAA